MLTVEMLQAIQQIVDDRLAGSQRSDIHFGTVASIQSEVDALVTFDGSAANVPVKIFGDTVAYEGDRVGLIKIGPWWVAFGSMTRRYVQANGATLDQTVGGTTSSGTYATLTDDVQFTFTKRDDLTSVRCAIHGSMRETSSNNSTFDWGLRFIGNQGTLDRTVTFSHINAATSGNVHTPFSGLTYVRGATTWNGTGLPAGTYDVHVIWRRLSGIGTGSVDTQDKISADCVEVMP